MTLLTCPVRGCGAPLGRHGAALRCPAGHVFDRAREGYWNLLQPQDRKSASAGDADAAVAARRRWLDRGFAQSLVGTLRGIVDRLVPEAGAVVLDAGCGEGTITAAMGIAPGREVCGIDLSVRAVRLAARRTPEATWIVANADRALPLASGSVDVVLSVFGRRHPAEFARVLRPAGHAVVAVPGPDDLAELREAAQGRAELRDRAGAVVAEMAPTLALVERAAWRERRRHDRAAIEDALAMTYRGARRRERERTAGLEALDVTLSAEILVFATGRFADEKEPGRTKS